ncbi:MAG: hypothetical protein ACT4PW_05010, partial [Acidimicrobiia bacterium]
MSAVPVPVDGAPAVRGVLADALEVHRDRFNATVAEARRARPDLDLDRLTGQLLGPVQAAVEACAVVAPGSAPRVLAALFGPVVDLVGQRRLGGGSHDGLMSSLARLAPALADEPRRLFASTANAVVNLLRSGLPAERWLERVVAAVALGADADDALRAGQVAAWAIGLAHCRDRALDVAATLADDLLGAALGRPGPLPVTATVERLRHDRWWRPGQAARAGDGPTVVHRVGGFRGFGGVFLSPPRIGRHEDRIMVLADDAAWCLHADGFGATLTRATPVPITSGAAPEGTVPDGVRPTAVVVAGDIGAATTASTYHVRVLGPTA